MKWLFPWPWKYGERQPLPPDDLPDDFSEDQDTGEDDEDDLKVNKKKDASK